MVDVSGFPFGGGGGGDGFHPVLWTRDWVILFGLSGTRFLPNHVSQAEGAGCLGDLGSLAWDDLALRALGYGRPEYPCVSSSDSSGGSVLVCLSQIWQAESY